MYFVRPRVVVTARGGEEKIKLIHESGETISWDGLRLSVTNGRNSETVFRNPKKYGFGQENEPLADVYPEIRQGVEVSIYGTSRGESLVVENTYHVVLKDITSGLTITDMNTRVRRKFD